ncbi:endospore germination permease [Paenibacillus sp. TRM 82003]|nr:endospore germination permease [Paenibacillus sp. TRM 82003]
MAQEISVSSRQLLFIGVGYTLNTTLISLPSQVIAIARMDAWLAYIIAALPIAVSIWLFSLVSRKYPGKDMFEILKERAPVVGRTIGAVYILFFFYILVRDLRMLTDFVNILLLQTTPLMIISLLIVATTILMARAGFEVICRLIEIWLPVLFGVMLLIPVALFREFEYKFFQPFFEYGLYAPMKASWYIVAYFGEVVALPFLLVGQTFRAKTGLLALGFGTAAMVLLTFYTILSLGTFIPSRVLYPTYEMVRHIRITDFLDRFDLPIVGLYLPTMLTKIAFSLYFVCHGLERLVPNYSSRDAAVPFGFLAFVCSFWFFRNVVSVFTFNSSWPYFAIPIVLLLPPLIYLITRVPRRTNPSSS